MAANLQQLSRRIKTAKNIAQVSRAMEMISASKIKKAQTAVENNRPYAQRITTLATSILSNTDLSKFHHPYINGGESPKTLLLVISSDKGLCGSLNTNLFKKLIEIDNKNLKIITLGKKAHRVSLRLGQEVIAGFNFGTTLPAYQIVFKLIEVINQEYLSGNVSKFQILSSSFQSIFLQIPDLKTVLPIPANEEPILLPYIFEPRAEDILADILPYYLEVILYNSILEAFTSEQAARMIAMQNAKNNALDIADYLTLSYNKSRQEKITSELLTLSNNE